MMVYRVPIVNIVMEGLQLLILVMARLILDDIWRLVVLIQVVMWVN